MDTLFLSWPERRSSTVDAERWPPHESSTKAQERAGVVEKTGIKERAIADERTVMKERANWTELNRRAGVGR